MTPRGFLTDTNILSELARPAPNRGVIGWARSVTVIALSAITVEEVYFGLAWKPNRLVQAWFESFLESSCEVLPVTAEVARRAGELRGGFRRKGIARTQADLLIAATASAHGLTLVTHNARDLEGCGVALLDPFV